MHAATERGTGPGQGRAGWKTYGVAAVVICLVFVGVLSLVALVRAADFAMAVFGEPSWSVTRRSATEPPNSNEMAQQTAMDQSQAANNGGAGAEDESLATPLDAGSDANETDTEDTPEAGVAGAGGVDGGAPDAAPLGTAGDASDLDAGTDAGADAGAAADAADAVVQTPGQICGDAVCPAGKVCCNESCGICADPGQACSQTICGMPLTLQSALCGPNTCNTGEVCCNPSCGICTPPGASCDTRVCANAVQYPESQMCGMATCNAGMVCCNPSCGICAPPGEPCSREVCD